MKKLYAQMEINHRGYYYQLTDSCKNNIFIKTPSWRPSLKTEIDNHCRQRRADRQSDGQLFGLKYLSFTSDRRTERLTRTACGFAIGSL